jgi:transposase
MRSHVAIQDWMVFSLGVHTTREDEWGSRKDCSWILGLSGFRVVTTEYDESAVQGRLTIRIERQGVRRYPCSGCGRRSGWVRSSRDRTWDDLPWAHHHVTLVYAQRRIRCRRCGIRTERVEFADPKARVTRRLRQLIGVDCQSMPTSHAAVRHGVSWSKARRAKHAFLREWDRTRVSRRPRHLGLDEVQRGKGQQFWTVLSDVVHGEVIGLRRDRTAETAKTLLTTELRARQRAAVTAVCMDMHRPYRNAVAEVLPKAHAVFDKFHVLQHASAALDEVRRHATPAGNGQARRSPQDGFDRGIHGLDDPEARQISKTSLAAACVRNGTGALYRGATALQGLCTTTSGIRSWAAPWPHPTIR